MTKALIGYTGFVGSNLLEQSHFESLYNSKNISEIEGRSHDTIVCAGVSATKWLSNQQPKADFAKIQGLIDHLRHAKAKKFILISTIDIYDHVDGVTESTIPDPNKQEPYGKNRYFLEQWVQENYQDYLIIRLPGLLGQHLKKNFIYDLLNPLPASIAPNLWSKINIAYQGVDLDFIRQFYFPDHLGNHLLQAPSNQKDRNKLVALFAEQKISSLMFTDSRSFFQFYPLKFLWRDIEIALAANIPILNLAVEPLQIQELVRYLYQQEFNNSISSKQPLFYNMQTLYDQVFSGAQGYLYNKQVVLENIRSFIQEMSGLSK